jgi:multidrug efflux pump subunit AcrA (membrane-fusion protein)
MKKYLKKIMMTPKLATSFALILVLVIGIFITIAHNSIQKKRLAAVSALAPETMSLDQTSSKDLTLSFPNMLVGEKIKSVSIKIGDKVKAGEILASLDDEDALGAVNQAKGAYEAAEANYQKIINGATGTAVDVAKAAVNTAQVNLDEVTKQQAVLVENAFRTLLNSSPTAEIVSDYSGYDAPTVSGTYECDKEGSYDLKTHSSANGVSVTYSGLENGTLLLTDVPRSLGNCGLFLSFDKTEQIFSDLEFTVQIPNTNAADYGVNNNAYQSALQTKEQTIAVAQAALDQENASLEAVAASARPEDVAAAQAQVESTQGALQIAESAENDMTIVAPVDGIIINVAITAGQIATPGIPAIELLSQ